MSENEIIHYGVKGMRWGVRRYRNEDGSLTPAGRRRISNAEVRYKKKKFTRKNIKNLLGNTILLKRRKMP